MTPREAYVHALTECSVELAETESTDIGLVESCLRRRYDELMPNGPTLGEVEAAYKASQTAGTTQKFYIDFFRNLRRRFPRIEPRNLYDIVRGDYETDGHADPFPELSDDGELII